MNLKELEDRTSHLCSLNSDWWVFLYHVKDVRLNKSGEQTTSIVLGSTVQEYLVPANRHASYSAVKPKRLQALLEKLARFGSTQRDSAGRELGERRRKEAEAVGRVFPGENR